MNSASVRHIVDDVATVTFQVEDLPAEVTRLKAAGARSRNDVTVGRGSSQVLLADPAGDPIELFQAPAP
jgi:hypothetical protein